MILVSWNDTGGNTILVRKDSLGGSDFYYDFQLGNFPVPHTNLSYDRIGDNYISHSPQSSDKYKVGKYSYSGDSITYFLEDVRLPWSMTTDDTILFFLLREYAGGSCNKILKTDKNGNILDTIFLKGGVAGAKRVGMKICPA